MRRDQNRRRGRLRAPASGRRSEVAAKDLFPQLARRRGGVHAYLLPQDTIELDILAKGIGETSRARLQANQDTVGLFVEGAAATACRA